MTVDTFMCIEHAHSDDHVICAALLARHGERAMVSKEDGHEELSEWDIAAGHAILEHAGGKITDFNGREILYGKPSFKNPSLILKSKNIL